MDREDVTVTGKATLSSLSAGAHTVTVYAWDEAGNVGASEPVIFTVELPEPFPTITLAAIASVMVAAVGLGMFIFLRKRKR